MRKLITLLLLVPFLTFGQSSGDGLDIDLVYKGIVGNADQPLSKVQVNDTIILALKLNNLDSIHQITYIHSSYIHCFLYFCRTYLLIFSKPLRRSSKRRSHFKTINFYCFT